LANCIDCGASNLGIPRTDLVVIDGAWYCNKCLTKKGTVKCHECGKQPFSSDEHFKTVDGRYLCTGCMEKMDIIRKYDYIMASVRSARSRTGASTRNTRKHALSALGILQELLERSLEDGEEITLALTGNSGEGLACSSKHVFVLKSGMATGSITGRKCVKYRWNEVTGIELKQGTLYGLVEIKGRGLPSFDVQDLTKAKRSENAVTFLASKKSDFEDALAKMKAHLRG